MSSKGPQKTNATRILAEKGVQFELRGYDVDEDDLSAETVAKKVGLPVEQVWKTLLFRGDKNGLGFAVIAAGTELDLKALARLTKDRKVELVSLKEVQPLTGYIRGGVTVFGAKKVLPVFADASITNHAIISVSAGVRGTQVFLDPKEYVRAANASLGVIST